MIYDAPSAVQYAHSETDYAEAPAPTEMTAFHEPSRMERPQYTVQRRVVPLEGGRILLRLRQNPVVEIDPNSMVCEVLGWGLRIPHHQIEEMSHQMARRFLELFSKADSQRLSEQEEAAWMRLQEEIDYGAYCADRAPPQYVEGILLRQTPVCRVEWHDGSKENLPPSTAKALQVLKPGDRFGAYVKLGRRGEAKSAERLTLLEANGGG